MIAGDQPVAQEQERRLRDVGQAVVAQRLDLAGVKEPLDLAAVDAVLAGQADQPRRAVERRHRAAPWSDSTSPRSRWPSSLKR